MVQGIKNSITQAKTTESQEASAEAVTTALNNFSDTQEAAREFSEAIRACPDSTEIIDAAREYLKSKCNVSHNLARGWVSPYASEQISRDYDPSEIGKDLLDTKNPKNDANFARLLAAVMQHGGYEIDDSELLNHINGREVGDGFLIA